MEIARKYPGRFLIISLAVVCVSYLACLSYTKHRLNKWYDCFMDKEQTGISVFYYSRWDWAGDLIKTEVSKDLSFTSEDNKDFKRDGFSIRVVGVFCPPKSGHYKFSLRSDDGGKLYIDQNLVIDNGEVHPVEERASTVFLTKGYHLIVIEYFQKLGRAELGFSWMKTGWPEREKDLGLYFNPAKSGFVWDKGIKQFKKINEFYEVISKALLVITFAIFAIYVVLILWERIYPVLLSLDALYKKHKILGISVILIVYLAINFYPIFFMNKMLVSDAGSPHVQDPGGPFWEIEPFVYLNHYYYFVTKSIPLWNPYIGTGIPLASKLHTGSFSPISFLSSIYPSYLTMDIFMLFRIFIAGLFMFLFLREIKLSFFIALIGSFYFMLAPPHIACINQFQMDTVAFLPAILYFSERAVNGQKKRQWILLSIFISLAVLGGNPEEIILVIAMLTIYFISRLLFLNNYSKIKCARNYFLSLTLGFLLASFFILPAVEYYLNSNVAATRSFSSGMDFSLDKLTFIVFPPKIPQIPPTTLYISIIPLFWFFIAFFNIKKMSRIGKSCFIFSLIYISIFLLMLFNNPVTNIIKHLPLISHIWWGKYASTFYAAFVIGACIGLDILLEQRRLVNSGLIFILGVLLGSYFLYAINCQGIKNRFTENPLVYYYLLVISGCIFLSFSKRSSWVLLLSILFLIDIFVSIPRPYAGRPKAVPCTQVIRYLKKIYEQYPSRVYPMGMNNFLCPNRNCIYQLPILDHSGILIPKRYLEFLVFSNVRDAKFGSLRRYLDLFNFEYVYSSSGRVFEDRLVEIHNEGPEYVYKNKEALGRVFIVHRAEKMQNSEDIFKRLSDPDFDFRHSIILEKDLPDKILTCNGAPIKDKSSARIISYLPNKVLIKAEMENDGFLVLSDTYYPGWKAYVDGNRTEIYLTDFMIRSIYLKKGWHIVEFVYRPFSFTLGLIISFIAIVYLVISFYKSSKKVEY